mmetsp:Transcript_8821/g.13339  ORF Transcript_8821/g.13339 Transcript_8821/m.13339 type:complete len:250 (-) Transcript_8821:2634-3383(-)
MMNSTDEGYSTEAPSDDLSAVWTAIIVLILIVTLIFVRFLCCGNCSVGDNPPDDEFYVMSTNERISPEQQRRYLERRRTLIMKSIVQKKAIRRTDSAEITLPHESELSKRSTVDRIEEGRNEESLNLDLSASDSSAQSDSDGGRQISPLDGSQQTESEMVQKEDIFVKSFHDHRSTHHGIDDSVSSSLYSPKECAICMSRYKHGDAICWSQNEKCFHAYHLSCMVEWLMKHNECPMCRRNFFRSEGNDK